MYKGILRRLVVKVESLFPTPLLCLIAMGDKTPAEVVEELTNNLSGAAVVEKAIVSNEDIHVIVPDSEIGSFYQSLRQVGGDGDMFRDGDRIRGFVKL